MPRVDADVFSDREISRLYIGAALSESKRVEAVLTEHGIDYVVNVELFRSGIFSRPRHGAVFYVDAAQAVGKIPVDVTEIDVDFLTLTGHKFHAAPGVGAVYAKTQKQLRPLIFGGPQELSLRPGTENMPGIVGLGKAAELRKNNFLKVVSKITAIRDLFETKILQTVPNTKINGNIEIFI